MDAIVLGGGVCGLATAMMLARDGLEVTVLERDPQGPPALLEDALERWERPGVSQFHQAHYMHPRFRHIVEQELPAVYERLIELGALPYDLVAELMPPGISDRATRPGDERYRTLTARRPVLELAFAQVAEDQPGVKIARGVHVTGLVAGSRAIKGVPHVCGVRTSAGEEIRADLVVDATGRRSVLPEWIWDIGGRPPYEEQEDWGFAYYGRAYRGELPQVRGSLVAPFGSISILTLPADNQTWLVGLTVSNKDRPMKQLRFEDRFNRVLRSMPLHAHWIDGEPQSEIKSMAGVVDRYRRFVVDESPVVTGLLPVADAWACTNPNFGRGISLGMMHAQRLRDLVRNMNGDPGAVALEWDEITERELTPWYRTQVDMDRARFEEVNATLEGREPESTAPDNTSVQLRKAFLVAMAHDADCFRAFLEVMGCLRTPEEVLAEPGIFEKIIAIGQEHEPPQAPGPDREELLALVA